MQDTYQWHRQSNGGGDGGFLRVRFLINWTSFSSKPLFNFTNWCVEGWYASLARTSPCGKWDRKSLCRPKICESFCRVISCFFCAIFNCRHTKETDFPYFCGIVQGFEWITFKTAGATVCIASLVAVPCFRHSQDKRGHEELHMKFDTGERRFFHICFRQEFGFSVFA